MRNTSLVEAAQDPVPAVPASATEPSRRALLTGRVMAGIVSFLLLLDAGGKLAQLTPVVEGTEQLGYPTHLVAVIGAIELLCVAVYLLPRTALLGAVLLTGYLGGAVATHLRVESPMWTHLFFPVYIGVLAWAALLLRDPRARALMPLRRDEVS